MSQLRWHRGSVHVFSDSKDIPDKVDLRLVVLPPNQHHKRKDEGSAAVRAAEEILTHHGERPREYQNRVLFLAPDAAGTTNLRNQVRRFLAWESIVDDADELNLDKHHEKESKKNLSDAKARVDASIRETYKFLLVPMQDPDAPDGLKTIAWEDEGLSLAGSNYDKAIESATRDREWVIKTWAPSHLHNLLCQWFWKEDQSSVGANKVWLDTCRYLYMPRLHNDRTFTNVVADGAAQTEWFGYALEEPEPGKYKGMVFGKLGSVYLDDASVLVKPDAVPEPPVDGGGSEPPVVDGSKPLPVSDSKKPPVDGGRRSSVRPGKASCRFHGTVDLDATDPIGSFTEIVQNVIEHFTAQYGNEVTLTLDVEAKRPGGFETKTVRTVKENAATLKFKTAEFEAD